MTISTELAIALITGAIGAITGGVALIAGFFSSKELREIIGAMAAEIDRLKERIAELEQENGDLKDWAERLTCQIKDAGMKPVEFIRHALEDAAREKK